MMAEFGFHTTRTTARTTAPELHALGREIRQALADPNAAITHADLDRGAVTVRKGTAWTEPQVAAVQGVLDPEAAIWRAVARARRRPDDVPEWKRKVCAWLCGHVTPRPPEPEPPAPTTFAIAVIVCGTNGRPVEGAQVRMDADQFIATTDAGGVVKFDEFRTVGTTIAIEKPGYDFYGLSVQLSGTNQNLCVGTPGSPTDLELPPFVQSFTTRAGLVRPDGKAIVDDNGHFHALGMTMFWAYQGWTRERDRFKQNIEFLRPYDYDYVRVLGQVAWPGWEINPDDAGYETTWGEIIDYLYDEAGLRVEFSILGDSGDYDPLAICAKVARVLKGREHKVMLLEMTNENKVDVPTMVQMAEYMRANTGVALIALSSPQGNEQLLIDGFHQAGCTAFTVHPERDDPDGTGWRQVRQAWGFKDFPGVICDNEPTGPHASIEEQSDPLVLTMMRANCHLCGAAQFILHVADMVRGQPDPAHNRQANLWEIANIDAILRGPRGIDGWLAPGIENWQHTSQHGSTSRVGDQPLLARGIWSDNVPGEPFGVDRAYGGVSGGSWVEVLNGSKDYVELTPAHALHAEAVDPLTGAIEASIDLNAGEVWVLPGDPASHAAYIVVGYFK